MRGPEASSHTRREQLPDSVLLLENVDKHSRGLYRTKTRVSTDLAQDELDAHDVQKVLSGQLGKS